MKTIRQTIAAIIGTGLLLSAPLAHATSVNITVNDNNSGSTVGGNLYVEGTGPSGNGIPIGQGGVVGNPSTWTTWYKGGPSSGPGALSGPSSEYQEVEPGMQTGAVWDLAAFVDPSPGRLGVLSGYDLANGYAGTTIGDIFVKVGGSPTNLADPNTPYSQFVTNTYGYDYAIHFNFGTSTFNVIKLDANTVIENGEYANSGNYNSASQPWRVASTTGGIVGGDLGTAVALSGPGANSLVYTNTLSAASASALAGFSVTSDYKYYAEISTNFLQAVTGNANGNPVVTYKLTMECGNDNMLGQQSSGFQQVPDGGATLGLIGMSLLSVVGLAKFRARRHVA